MRRVIKATESSQFERFTGHLPDLGGPKRRNQPGEENAIPAGQGAQFPNAMPGAADEAANVLQEVLIRTERETELLQRKLEEMVTRSESQQAEAFERGKREGLQQSDEETTLRLDVLKQALKQANANFAANSAQVEILALQVARAALCRILGEADSQSALLQQLIAFQIECFAQERPMCLRLAKADFLDTGATARIASEWPDIEVITDAKLSPGECLLTLELGEVDIGLPGQVERMETFFKALIAEREQSASLTASGQSQ